MVARSVTMMPLPLGSASSMPYSTRNWALASEGVELRATLPRWLAPLMSVVLTGILVSKQKALSGNSSLIRATVDCPDQVLISLVLNHTLPLVTSHPVQVSGILALVPALSGFE